MCIISLERRNQIFAIKKNGPITELHSHLLRFLSYQSLILLGCSLEMATATMAKRSCVRCPKGPGQVICKGCQQHFCLKHLPEHRQELSQQMDALTLEHDQLQRNLTEESDDQPHPLFARIDHWELQSIERIKEVSDEVRSQLRESIARTKKNICDSLHRIAANLDENQRTETFTETDL